MVCSDKITYILEYLLYPQPQCARLLARGVCCGCDVSVKRTLGKFLFCFF